MKNNHLLYASAGIFSNFCVLISIASFAQQDILMDSESELIKKYDLHIDEIGWVYFNKKPSVNQLINEITQNKGSFGLRSEDILKTRIGTDLDLLTSNPQLTNESPLRINQTHNGWEVEGAEFSIHFDGDNDVELMHGKLAKNLPSDKSVGINEKVALNTALTYVDAKKYAWDDPNWEQGIKMDTEDPDATYYPVGKLMYARVKPDNDFSASNFKLVYRFEIKALEPLDQLEVMIDARSGDLIRKQSLNEHAWGNVNSMYNGPQGFTTQWRGFPDYDYVLKDTDSGDKLHTLRWDSNPWWQRPEVDDNDNVWSEPAASTHWAVQVAWNYFIQQHGRNGMDNAGGKIRIEAEALNVDAHFTREGGYDYLYFGRTPNGVNGSLAAIDILGHEFTHGIVDHTSELMSQGESGALNESFADIFGVMVERLVQGTPDWIMGDDQGLNFRTRSLQNPNTTFPETDGTTGPVYQAPSADTFQGTWWKNPTNLADDWGGVHSNSGVQNFWFFLLANGGTGTNDPPFNQAYNVQGIGIVDAARIAFRNMTVYMQPSSTYADARAGAINSATWLFGACSNQVHANDKCMGSSRCWSHCRYLSS